MSLLSKRILYPTLSVKPEIIFGKGSLNVLKNLPGENFLILASNSFIHSESYSKLTEKILSTKKYNLECVQNSFEETINILKNKYIDWPPEIIIAIGSGTVLDSAKVLRHFLSFSEESFDSLAKSYSNPIPKVRLVSIPSTPNTSSEINNIAVIKNNQEEKVPYVNKTFCPDLAVIDPILLSSIPDNIMFDCVSDIFAHAFEGSRSRLSNNLYKTMALNSIRNLKENLNLFVSDHFNYEAIENIQFIGQQAGTVAENAFVGIIHALAHSLESLTKKSHGSTLHLLLGPMLEWISKNSDKHNFEFNVFYNAWNELDLESTADYKLVNKVDSNEWSKLTFKDPSIKTDPIKFKEEDIRKLIEWLQSRN